MLKILQELRPEFDFTDSDDFIEDGYLDSFDVVSLVSEIENQYQVLVDGLDVVPENFSSVEAICNLINKSEKRD